MPDATPLVAVHMAPAAATAHVVRRLWDDGAAVLALPPDDTAARRLVAAARPTGIWQDSGVVALRDGRGVDAGTAVVIATSGSTGEPRQVVLSAAAVTASARASLRRLGVGHGDRWLCCLPLHHVAGLQVLIRSEQMSRAAIVHPRFDPDAVAAQRDVTLVALVPTMLRRLLDAGADLSHLRTVLLGGAPPGPGLLAEASQRGLDVVETYGMTETSGGCVYDGIPLDGVDVRVERGRIEVRGPVLFDGYRSAGALTSPAVRDGWLRTADLGRLDGDRLVVLGRADEVIITGGENVAAGAVAAALEQHPSVSEAAVVGRDDPEWGQRVVAVVVAGDSPPVLPELRDHVGALLGRHAAPRELVVVPALPRLATGKVDRRAVQALA